MFTKHKDFPLLSDCYQIDEGEVVLAGPIAQERYLKDWRESGKPYVVINTRQAGKITSYYRRYNEELIAYLHKLAEGKMDYFLIRSNSEYIDTVQNFAFANLITTEKKRGSKSLHKVSITLLGIEFLQLYNKYKGIRKIRVTKKTDPNDLKAVKNFF